MSNDEKTGFAKGDSLCCHKCGDVIWIAVTDVPFQSPIRSADWKRPNGDPLEWQAVLECRSCGYLFDSLDSVGKVTVGSVFEEAPEQETSKWGWYVCTGAVMAAPKVNGPFDSPLEALEDVAKCAEEDGKITLSTLKYPNPCDYVSLDLLLDGATDAAWHDGFSGVDSTSFFIGEGKEVAAEVAFNSMVAKWVEDWVTVAEGAWSMGTEEKYVGTVAELRKKLT